MSRRFASAALAALLACGVAGPALAQDWPQPGKTIQLIVPAPGGSGTGDTIARRPRRRDAVAPEDDLRRSTTRPAPTATSAPPPRPTTPGDGYHFLFSWAGTLGGQQGAVQEPGVRRAEGLRADPAGRRRAQHPRRQQRHPGQGPRRVRALRQGQPGQAQLRLDRHRQLDAPGRRALHARDRRADDPRALQRAGHRHHQPDRRRDPAHVPARSPASPAR